MCHSLVFRIGFAPLAPSPATGSKCPASSAAASHVSDGEQELLAVDPSAAAASFAIAAVRGRGRQCCRLLLRQRCWSTARDFHGRGRRGHGDER